MKLKIIFLAVAAVMLAGCTAMVDLSDQQFDRVMTQSRQSSQETPAAASVTAELRLAYVMSDSLNPFKCESQINQELIDLMYDSLVKLDKTWYPQNLLAQEITMEGKTCRIRLNSQVQFTDGSLITARDVLYSLESAMGQGLWSSSLANVASYRQGEDNTVEIDLFSADGNFPALLTFPIVKDGTAGNEFPVGTGKYYVSGTWEKGILLSPNPLYFEEIKTIETVRLTGVSDADGLTFSLKSGELDYIYSDLSTPELSNMSTSSVPVTLNNLVYVGVNAGRSFFSQSNFRRAISLAINRDEIVSKAYVSRAIGTIYPFNPEFYQMEEVDTTTQRNLTLARELLDEMGLTEKNEQGFRLSRGSEITLSLLINSENAYRNSAATLIAEQLEQIGIRVNVVSKSFDKYQSSLTIDDYDMYIGEIRLRDNMDFSTLLTAGYGLGYNTPYCEELTDIYGDYRESGENIAGVCDRFYTDMPFIPLVFRQGIVSFNREFGAEVVATQQDIFYNIVQW